VKKIFFLFVSIFFSCICIFSSPIDTVFTTYRNGVFVTQFQRKVNASNKAANYVADELVTQFNSIPDNLFTWALKGLGLNGQKGLEVKIDLKSADFDKKTGITHGFVDVDVANITTFKDVPIDAIVVKSNLNNGGRKVNADVINSRFLIEKARGTFVTIPQGESEQLFIANLTIKFGWFFNIFINEKRYREMVEWRVKKFTENMKFEAEMYNKKLQIQQGK